MIQKLRPDREFLAIEDWKLEENQFNEHAKLQQIRVTNILRNLLGKRKHLGYNSSGAHLLLP